MQKVVNQVELGNRVVKIRERLGMKQNELAKRTGINVSVVNRIEKNERPARDTEITSIANVLGVTTDYLLGRTDDPEKTHDDEFEAFRNNPELEVWYRNLPKSSEEELEMLKEMYEIWRKRNK
jgi:transcriptional regulator with XRE-family HTH domain